MIVRQGASDRRPVGDGRNEPMTDFAQKAGRLRNAVEPAAAGVYLAPESHAAYQALGFDGSPVIADGVARPELKAYLAGRSACRGPTAR
jgi:hypothetical protein